MDEAFFFVFTAGAGNTAGHSVPCRGSSGQKWYMQRFYLHVGFASGSEWLRMQPAYTRDATVPADGWTHATTTALTGGRVLIKY